jgi:OCT family organic cation transporter-like MFS transporter 4/5
MVEASQSIFNFGVMLGAIIFTTIADQIGRKPVHLACQWAMIVIGTAIAFSTNYTTFAILRLLLGAVREVQTVLSTVPFSVAVLQWLT